MTKWNIREYVQDNYSNSTFFWTARQLRGKHGGVISRVSDRAANMLLCFIDVDDIMYLHIIHTYMYMYIYIYIYVYKLLCLNSNGR